MNRHTHKWEEKGIYFICKECNRKKLVTKDGIGVRKDGKKYTVRPHRDRFFYPYEWMKFFDSLTRDRQKMTFDVLINTGARINEAQNIKVNDIDFQRKTLVLRVTKIKAVLGEKSPRPRIISISSQFCKRLNKYIKDNQLKSDDNLNLLTETASLYVIKSKMKKIVDDYFMFAPHSVRKTHGNYLKALQCTSDTEICKRMGHDMGTFLNHYVSPDIFDFKDKQNMRLILGDLYSR